MCPVIILTMGVWSCLLKYDSKETQQLHFLRVQGGSCYVKKMKLKNKDLNVEMLEMQIKFF